MKNIAVDIGNSRIKAGVFESSQLVESIQFQESEQLNSWLKQPHDNLIISSVSVDVAEWKSSSKTKNSRILLSSKTPLPLTIKYSTPATLGVDRIADACGALQLFPKSDCLVIDLGTCINYELVDSEANYWGGIISPGVSIRFKSMNTFTARLPLVDAVGNPELIGDSTATCMQSGVMNGILEEMNGVIGRLKQKYPNLNVILTGGDLSFFENQLKHSIFAAPELVLLGLNRILTHNVSK